MTKNVNTVLVTGGHGFIGHHVVAKYLKLGWKVVVLDRHIIYPTIYKQDRAEEQYMLYKERERYLRSIGDYVFIKGDVRDSWKTQLIDNLIDPSSITHLVHLANIPRQAEAQEMPAATAEIMAGLTYMHQLDRLMNAVFISSSMVYGDFSSPIKEDEEFDPKGIYGSTRLVGEHFFQKIASLHPNRYDLVANVIRPTAVYGPGDSTIRVVGKFIEAALNNEPLIVRGSNEVMDFTYVKDVAKAIVAASQVRVGQPYLQYDATQALEDQHWKSAVHGIQVFNVSRGLEEVKIVDLANRVVHLTQSASVVAVISKDDSMPSRHLLDCEHAKAKLGYESKYALEKGLVKTIEDIQQRMMKRVIA